MICPACNALGSPNPTCPACGSAASDEGRTEDWNGPYSPYSPADIPLASSTFRQDAAEACLHIACCPQCAATFTYPVSLWSMEKD
ncbi:hypothetical protein [Cohnella sp. AR92]|uniref:hypothetical protein n=1 Tax=Cohnella sp. AR92 TaxID=648716 RepID=UPI000F8EAA07|nr:hypothetical protein [Cohnella sp. AR92]RUS45972.1 hypothetical protein ELR57_16100 [Cohnella sp. AR92]